MRPTVLALDPGVRFGVAWTLGDGSTDPRLTTSWELAGIADPGARYLELEERLAKAPEAAYVAFESIPHHLGAAAARWHHGYLATVQTWCARVGCGLLIVTPAAVRKWATGLGVARGLDEKERMREAALERWTLPEQQSAISDQLSHDAIDALWLCEWAVAQLEPQGDAAA